MELSTGPLKVFLSGTQEDMQPERQVVELAISELCLIPVRAENIGSQTVSPRQTILDAVSKCDIYLGIYGGRYGRRVPDLNVSATELEYNEAQRIGKPTLVYLKSVPHPDPEQLRFLSRVQDFDACYFRRPPFTSSQQVYEWVKQDLTNLISELVRNPDGVYRRQLALSYAGEVRQKFEYWRRRYIALPATTSLSGYQEDRSLDVGSVASVPFMFRPSGFRLTYRESPDDEVQPKRIDKKYEDIRDAVAEVADVVILGDPGAGKTTSLWRLMLDYSERAVHDLSSLLPILLPLGGYDGESDILHSSCGNWLKQQSKLNKAYLFHFQHTAGSQSMLKAN